MLGRGSIFHSWSRNEDPSCFVAKKSQCQILWTEEPGGLQSLGSQRIGHDWPTNTFTFSLWLLNLNDQHRALHFLTVYTSVQIWNIYNKNATFRVLFHRTDFLCPHSYLLWGFHYLWMLSSNNKVTSSLNISLKQHQGLTTNHRHHHPSKHYLSRQPLLYSKPAGRPLISPSRGNEPQMTQPVRAQLELVLLQKFTP